MYGRQLSQGYDWIADPSSYRRYGHVPDNRCYHCGIRFLNAKYAAYCNVCDNEMSPPHEERIFVVTRYEPQAKPPVREGYWSTRKQLIRNRIRIPDDVTDEDYKQKMDNIEKVDAERPLFLRPEPEFKTAMQQAKEESDGWMQKKREEFEEDG